MSNCSVPLNILSFLSKVEVINMQCTCNQRSALITWNHRMAVIEQATRVTSVTGLVQAMIDSIPDHGRGQARQCFCPQHGLPADSQCQVCKVLLELGQRHLPARDQLVMSSGAKLVRGNGHAIIESLTLRSATGAGWDLRSFIETSFAAWGDVLRARDPDSSDDADDSPSDCTSGDYDSGYDSGDYDSTRYNSGDYDSTGFDSGDDNSSVSDDPSEAHDDDAHEVDRLFAVIDASIY
ncbi:unnamed protein product [Effrenium voratum]|uniref:Uncharacterized protein n=1 Tax=Effrenium voratum TaxID=2562239 RepID=A0AA36J8C3_9DINO|nr:unnamed protein product [Effrenium voratum]